MALDTFETLLSLGTGFASGASKRRRENELIELDIKQKEQTARRSRINSIEKSLITLFNTDRFTAESMMAALNSVPQLVNDERSPFGVLEKKPAGAGDPSKRELFEQRTLQFEETQERLTEQFETVQERLTKNEKADQAELARKARLTKEAKLETKRTKKIKGKLEQFDKQIKNHRARISQILREFKDFEFKKQPDRKKRLEFEIKNRENKIKSLETQSENLIRRIGSTGRDKFIQSPFGGTLRTQENSKAQLQRLEAQVKQDIQSGIISAENGFFKIVELRKQLGTQ